MSIRTMSEPADAIRIRRVTPAAAGLAGPIGFAALVVLGGMLVSQPAEAAPRLCGERDQILKGLERARDETPQALGLSSDGGVVEVLVSPDGGWTMLVTYPKRPTCVVAAGPAWEMRRLAGQSA
jgi:hypothetical protein